MTAGLQNLKHIVVVMMENRSFDHMLGALKAEDPRIDGLSGTESNLDTTNEVLSFNRSSIPIPIIISPPFISNSSTVVRWGSRS